MAKGEGFGIEVVVFTWIVAILINIAWIGAIGFGLYLGIKWLMQNT